MHNVLPITKLNTKTIGTEIVLPNTNSGMSQGCPYVFLAFIILYVCSNTITTSRITDEESTYK